METSIYWKKNKNTVLQNVAKDTPDTKTILTTPRSPKSHRNLHSYMLRYTWNITLLGSQVKINSKKKSTNWALFNISISLWRYIGNVFENLPLTYNARLKCYSIFAAWKRDKAYECLNMYLSISFSHGEMSVLWWCWCCKKSTKVWYTFYYCVVTKGTYLQWKQFMYVWYVLI